MAKEDIPIILLIVLCSLIITVGAVLNGSVVLQVMALVGWLLVLFSIYFFRDPERKIPNENNIIVSPADGTVILIGPTHEDEFFKSGVQQISIFMSVFDVHVNRIPIDGRIAYFRYQTGKFLQAYKDDASYENEQTIILIENENIKVLFKQIAGILARRIVCHLRNGMNVNQGERFGMIKFGSRVDMILPKEVKLNIKLKQKVTAGKTIIGHYYSR